MNQNKVKNLIVCFGTGLSSGCRIRKILYIYIYIYFFFIRMYIIINIYIYIIYSNEMLNKKRMNERK